MKKIKKTHIILIAASVLILLGCGGVTGYLLFSNYQNVRLLKQAQRNFQRGDDESLELAETQLLQVISNDDDNEEAYVMLGKIAAKRKIYPEQVYYCYMAHRLNPLSAENKAEYINSLCFARYFDRLENFLAHQAELSDREEQILLYAAGHNGNINKYKDKLAQEGQGKSLAQLALLLFKSENTSAQDKLELLAALDPQTDDAFFQQEKLVAAAELYLAVQDFDNAGKALEQAYELNETAFAPVLGRFYARYRSFGQALEVWEKYLDICHDPVIAMQAAELYCLLKQTDKIAQLREQFQADSGNTGMLCCYYFDALTAFTGNDMAALYEYTLPLRKSIDTPLAHFMFLCADLQHNDPVAIREDYTALLKHRNYLDLQERADGLIADYIKQNYRDKSKSEQLLMMADTLYRRKPDVFIAKLMLLARKKKNMTDLPLLQDALKRFGNDQGIVKIAIEYYLVHDPAESARLIALYKQKFPEQSRDMLRYEIVVAIRKKEFDRVSALFQQNFSPELLNEYWIFASSAQREKDLLFLSRDKHYAPYCQALLLLKKGDKKSACDLLENADDRRNPALLFFAAKTLAENGRNQAALEKYRRFPADSSYQLAVLLNTAELLAENGDLEEALDKARQAYDLEPGSADVQFCYADKLYKCGQLTKIPDVVKLSEQTPYRREMKKFYIAGMQQRIVECNADTQKEKLRELCRQLLVVDPDNNTALERLKILNKMPR